MFVVLACDCIQCPHRCVLSLRTLSVFAIVVFVVRSFSGWVDERKRSRELDETKAMVFVRLLYVFLTVVAIARKVVRVQMMVKFGSRNGPRKHRLLQRKFEAE